MKNVGLLLLCAAIGACGAADVRTGRQSVTIANVDTLVSTTSGAIAYAVDMDVDPSGVLYVADYRANQLLRIDPASGDTLRIGRRGAGPGELDGPWAVRPTRDGVLVADRGNGRMQRLTSTGEYLGSLPMTPMVMRALPYVTSDGGLVISTSGRDSSLAIVFDSSSNVLRRVGTPVVVPPAIADFRAIKATIRSGEIPADLRNEALVAAGSDGAVWIVLQTEAEIRKYDANGSLFWSLPVSEPEMDVTRAEFFRRNRENADPAMFYSLRFFRDAAVVGDELWVLLDTAAGSRAVVLTISGDGSVSRRIEIAGGGAASSIAVDAERGLLFLFTDEDAQLLSARLPGNAAPELRPD